MKVSPQALPLTPEEIRFVRGLRRRIEHGEVLEQHLSPAEVATRLRLNKRTVLDLCGKAEGFPNATKPFHTKVLIPISDVNRFLERRRLAPNSVQAPAPEAMYG